MSGLPEEEIHAFVDGQLEPARRQAVAAWLAEHPAEMQRARAYEAQKELLRAALLMEDEGEPAPRTAALEAALLRRLRRRTGRLPPALGRAAAVALLLATGWLGHVLFQRHVEAKLPEAVEDAAQAHEIFAQDPLRPVELPASDSQEIVAWFSGHLGEPIQIPDLRPLGLRFVGGRLLGTEEGPLAQLLYEDREGRRLGVYLSTQPIDLDREIQVAHVRDLTAGYWREGELIYTVVADTPTEQLIFIASEIGAFDAGDRM